MVKSRLVMLMRSGKPSEEENDDAGTGLEMKVTAEAMPPSRCEVAKFRSLRIKLRITGRQREQKRTDRVEGRRQGWVGLQVPSWWLPLPHRNRPGALKAHRLEGSAK